MNILIITHFYEVDGVMGSVRWTSLAHRLAKKHNVFIVTHDHNGDKKYTIEKNENIEIFYIDNECEYVKRGNKRRSASTGSINSVVKAGKKQSILKAFKNFLRSSLYMLSMCFTAKKNAKFIKNELENNNIKIDYIISTSRPFINCFTAYFLSKKKKTPWLLDQRDLPYSDGASNIEINSFKRAFHRFDKYVTKYTLVSRGMADSFLEFCNFKIKQRDKTFVLNNGYDLSHKSKIVTKKENEKLTIAYVGDLYEGKRDATILFDALKNVMNNHDFSITDIIIDYAGNSSESLNQNARNYGFEEMISDRGRVPHKEAIKMLQEADILLLLTWNTYMDRGILPGKLYEYMMVKKPIICITAGEIPNGEAEGMIKDMNLGVAVNYCDYEQGVNELAEFLSKQIERKKNGEPLIFEPVTEEVEKFDYDNLVNKLSKIMFGEN